MSLEGSKFFFNKKWVKFELVVCGGLGLCLGGWLLGNVMGGGLVIGKLVLVWGLILCCGNWVFVMIFGCWLINFVVFLIGFIVLLSFSFFVEWMYLFCFLRFDI